MRYLQVWCMFKRPNLQIHDVKRDKIKNQLQQACSLMKLQPKICQLRERQPNMRCIQNSKQMWPEKNFPMKYHSQNQDIR